MADEVWFLSSQVSSSWGLLLHVIVSFLFNNFGSSLLSTMRFFSGNLVLILLHPFFKFSNLRAHTELSAFYVETARAKIGCQFWRKNVKPPTFKNDHTYHSPMKTTKLELVHIKLYFILCLFTFVWFQICKSYNLKFIWLDLSSKNWKKLYYFSVTEKNHSANQHISMAGSPCKCLEIKKCPRFLWNLSI